MHVWRANLDVGDEGVDGLLCEEERTRARSLLSERDRRRWARARGVLRALLGDYLRADPSTVRLAVGAHGKPELLDATLRSTAVSEPAPAAHPGLRFNVSHSGGLALYAFTAEGAIGVDIEVARRAIKAVAIARRAFGPAEASRLQGLQPGVREREFLRAWVRHEAERKCRGTGIGRCEGAGGERPRIAELDVGPRAAAAVAVELEHAAAAVEADADRSAAVGVAAGEDRYGAPVRGLDLRCWEWAPDRRVPARSGRSSAGARGSSPRSPA